MPLPAAVRNRADRAAELIRNHGQPAQQPPATPKPAATPPAPKADATDVETLKTQLAEAQEAMRKANERANTAEGIAKSNGAELRAARDDLKKAQEAVKAAEESAKKKLETLTITSLNADERKLAGEDMVTVAAKVAREVAESVFDTRSKPFTERMNLFDQMGEEAYAMALEEIPNFAQQNDDPKFVAWLNQPDPRTGHLRMNRIKRAEAARQGHLVVEIFAAFREGREIGAPKSTEAPPAPKTGPGAMIDAGAGGGEQPQPPEPGAKRTWTGAEIRRHYDEKKLGYWRGKEEEWRKLEQDIFAARAEGRIQG